jgi:nucleoside-diphosphate-sugar epimerase
MELTAPGFSRDPIFVEDLVEASLLTLGVKKAYGKVINVGSGRQWSNEQIVELIQSITGRKIELQVGAYPPSPSDTQNWVADISRARRYLGWQPKHSLRSGLEKTIAWMRTHLDVYDDWKATLSP